MQNKRDENMKSLFSHYNFFPKNRRGQELSTTAIILIILGVVVLVILILGFALGWDKIAPWISKDNVNQIVDACSNACTTKSTYDICLRKRDVIAEGTTYKNFTCYYMQEEMKSDLSKDFGVSACSGVDCSNVEFITTATLPLDSGTGGECTGHSGKYIQYYEKEKKQIHDFSCPK